MSWFNKLIARYMPQQPAPAPAPLAPPPQNVAPAPNPNGPPVGTVGGNGAQTVYVPPIAPAVVLEVPPQPVAPAPAPAPAPAKPDPSIAPAYPANLPKGYEWGYNGQAGVWTWIFTGAGLPNPRQQFIDAGGNVGQYAAFDIFVQNSKMQSAPFADQYAAWLKCVAASDAELVRADTPVDWGSAWKKALCVLQVTPHGESCAEITRNYNKMVQSGQSPSLFMTYMFEASPTQLAFEPAFGRPLWAALGGAFISPGSMRGGLHLADDEGYPGNCQIRGTDFVITRQDGTEFVWPLDCDHPEKGALSLHGGYPAYGTRY